MPSVLSAVFAWLVLVPMVAVGFVVALLDRLHRPPLPFPRDLAALARKRDWCVRMLREGGALPADAQVSDYRVSPLMETVAFRSCSGFLRVEWGEHALDCFVKFAPTAGSLWNRTVFNLQLNAVKEVLFNGRFLAEHEGLPAPRTFVAKASPLSGNLCLITERMAPAIEYREDEPSLPEAHIDAAIDGLAALHARCWGARTKLVRPIGPQVVRWFDSLAGLTGWSRAARTLLTGSWSRMNEPQTVLHGDARIGNMLFGSRFVLIDWQAVRLGRAAFDLAYFLLLSLTPEQRRAVEQRVIDRYHRELQGNGVGTYSADELDEDYRHACLCVLVLLSLPLLSGEASADATTAKGFVYGMGIWRARLQEAFATFDWAWLTARYGLAETEGRAAVAQMLAVIERRLTRVGR